jgi:CRP-like cAMP-binding protein
VDELVRGFKESEKLRALQVTYLPQEVVFFEDDTTSEMYILLSGKVEILKDGKRIAVVEEEGSYLGELSTLLGIPRSATVRTMSSCQFVVVDSDKVMDFLASSPALGLKLARMLADRLVKMNLEHVRLERTIELLMERLRETNEKVQKRDKQIEHLVARIEKIQHLHP